MSGRKIAESDWVLLLLSSGERRLVQVRANAKIHIGQSHVSAAPLLGTPFGTNFRLENEGKKQDHKLVVDPRTVEEIDSAVTSALADMCGTAGPEASNAALNDDGNAQMLNEHAIKKMKLEGAQGEAIVRALAQNSTSFSGKTAFSQEKWMKKKAKRHLHHLTAARPTALSVVDMYTIKGPEKVCSLRRDSLGLLLALSNVQPSSRALVLDSCLGLLAAAAAQRVGDGGAVLALHLQRPSLEAARWLNLEEGSMRALGSCSLLQLLRCPAAGEAVAPEPEGSTGGDTGGDAGMAEGGTEPDAEPPYGSTEPVYGGSGSVSGAPSSSAGCEAGAEAPKASESRARESKSARKLRDSDVAAWVAGGFTSLLVACRESPLAALPQLLSRLQDGSPFVLYNPSSAPLADCMHYCQKHELAVRMQLLEGFTRAYQVAPNRTHPHMNTYPPTGCVLSGVKEPSAALATQPAEAEDNEEAEDNDESAEDAGYSQIGFNSDGDDSEEDEVEAREQTGQSEEVETGGLDDNRARAVAEQAVQAEGSAVQAVGSASWVSFAHERLPERLPELELRGSMEPRQGARAAPASAYVAGEAAGEAAGDGWTSGAFDFDDDGWSAAIELLVTKARGDEDASAGQAASAGSQAVTKDTPPLDQEQIDLIKRTMADVQITPPPWVRRMQQLQKVQQMQQQMHATAGTPPLEGGAPPPGEQWPQHLQQLPGASIAAALPLVPPAANAVSSISGVWVPRRVSAKQLAAERRELREQRKRSPASQPPPPSS